MLNRVHAFAAAAALTLLSSVASAGYVTYTTRTDFAATLGASVTDDYSKAGYVFIQSDASMSAVLGETDYRSTGFANLNIVSGGAYCAGCNGSYEMSFTTTSVGDADGVFGVGLDIVGNSEQLPYWAQVTLGDGTLAEFALPTGSSFFGITSAQDIRSIHFGLRGGGSTTSGSFLIDNLTIGADLSDAPGGLPTTGNVPEPASLALVGLALAAASRARRRQARS